ncbi:MAG: class I SAM-dependent methyltransferase [Actinomycetes bacterium]
MREQRLVFGEDAGLYDEARPSYPSDVVDDVVGLVGAAARGLDVGCGTGKATVLLASRGLTGVGVEADPSMAAVARRHLATTPGWRVDVADFEAWVPSADSTPFDLVCSAQAWHWLDPQVRLDKAHRLLRTGGWLTLWWNRPDGTDSPIRRDIDEVYHALAPGLTTRGLTSSGPPVVDDVPADLSFADPVQRSYAWSASYTAERWTALLRTQSDHRMLPPDRRELLLRAVGEVIVAHGGVYHHPYVCWLWAAQKH